MAKKNVDEKALKDNDLLIKVAMFKEKFYPRKWAEYDKARIGTLKLMPANHSIDALKKDYKSMEAMIFGNYPSFEEIMDELNMLEKKINGS